MISDLLPEGLERRVAAIEALEHDVDELNRLVASAREQLAEPRYVLTDTGRRALDEDRRARALEALFGQPWPTVAEAGSTHACEHCGTSIAVRPRGPLLCTVCRQVRGLVCGDCRQRLAGPCDGCATVAVHRQGTCQWCDLYRAQEIPLPGHCPEQDVRADMAASAQLHDCLDDLGDQPESEATL